jgi:hypothetical protein
MKKDVHSFAEGRSVAKLISKETLNHRGLVEMVTGLDVFKDTPLAYKKAYEALGVDLINRVPLKNTPEPCSEGEVRGIENTQYSRQSLGIYDTCLRRSFDRFETLNVKHLEYNQLITPVPHPCTAEDICSREYFLGESGCYYPMLYTTLFMWGVEVFGWEHFMESAFMEQDKFHTQFIIPCAEKSKKIIQIMANNSSCPFIFLHDDLASSTGPVFPPSWYEDYIFPHYEEIFAPAKKAGKKIILVADGNMSVFLPRLIDLGVDGFMFESPATPIEAVIENFGVPGKFFIGGIETSLLTFGTPSEIKKMVYDLMEKVKDYSGFALASGGGLHGNIPLENLIAYFDARADIGASPKDWQTRGKK